MIKSQYRNTIVKILLSCILSVVFFSTSMLHAVEKSKATSANEYPDKYRIQFGAYYIEDTNTEVSINSSVGNIGTVIDMERDLGTNDKLSIPRLDAYYRFTDKHRIDFSWFQVSRSGTKTTSIDIKINGETYSASSVVDSKIKTNFYKLSYGYSFYRSSKVELSFSAGLNVLEYEITIDNKSSGSKQAAEVTAPLPIFGLRMDYSIAPAWLVHFRFETFYIEFDDSFRGSLLDSELGVEYRMFKNVGLGIGFNRLAIDAKIKTTKYTGGVTDLYRGVNIYAAAYF